MGQLSNRQILLLAPGANREGKQPIHAGLQAQQLPAREQGAQVAKQQAKQQRPSADRQGRTPGQTAIAQVFPTAPSRGGHDRQGAGG